MAAFSGPQIIPHLESSEDFTLFDCKWVPCSTRFVVLGTKTNGEGILRVYTLAEEGIRKLDEITTPKALKCATFAASTLEDRFVAVGDFGGTLSVLDPEQLDKAVYRVRAHQDLINCIDGVGGLGVGKGAPEIATGSRDGCVKVWDVRLADRPVACMQSAESDVKRDCWAVSFGHSASDSDRMVASGYDNGDLKMFDLRTMKLYWETNVGAGVCSLQFDRKDIAMNKLLATCMEGRTSVWDLRTLHEKHGFAGVSLTHEKATIWSGRHLPQNRDVFMTSSGSGSVALWRYEYPAERAQKNKDDGGLEGVAGQLHCLQEHQLGDQPVAGLDWSADKTGLLLTVSFDQKIRVLIVTRLNVL
jgi:WD40 repeat protein